MTQVGKYNDEYFRILQMLLGRITTLTSITVICKDRPSLARQRVPRNRSTSTEDSNQHEVYDRSSIWVNTVKGQVLCEEGVLISTNGLSTVRIQRHLMMKRRNYWYRMTMIFIDSSWYLNETTDLWTNTPNSWVKKEISAPGLLIDTPRTKTPTGGLRELDNPQE